MPRRIGAQLDQVVGGPGIFGHLRPRSLEHVVDLSSANSGVGSLDVVLLGFTNRSGSHFVGEAVSNTFPVSRFGEPLREVAVKRWAGKGRDEEKKTLGAYLSALSSDDGEALGLKGAVQQIRDLVRAGVNTESRSFRVIHVVREDGPAQAVSVLNAFTTRQWAAFMEAEVDESEVVYDYGKLSRIIVSTAKENRLISLLCDLHDIPRLRVEYEDFVANPNASLEKIGSFLNMAPREQIQNTRRFQKQDTPAKMAMLDRLRSDLKKASLFP